MQPEGNVKKRSGVNLNSSELIIMSGRMDVPKCH